LGIAGSCAEAEGRIGETEFKIQLLQSASKANLLDPTPKTVSREGMLDRKNTIVKAVLLDMVSPGLTPPSPASLSDQPLSRQVRPVQPLAIEFIDLVRLDMPRFWTVALQRGIQIRLHPILLETLKPL
jgi:hypothetical protein